MSASFQTIVALGIVAIAVAFLLISTFRKKKTTGCGSEGCHAVSPELKALQKKLRR